MKFVLVYGNPFDGLTLVGPFESSEDAEGYADAEREIRNDTWWIANLGNPNISKNE